MYVDDLKLLHMDKGMVEDIIKCLSKKFGKEIPHATTRGKIQ